MVETLKVRGEVKPDDSTSRDDEVDAGLEDIGHRVIQPEGHLAREQLLRVVAQELS